MPSRIADYLRSADRLRLPPTGPADAEATASASADAQDKAHAEHALREILGLLKMRSGRDFSYYKRATVLRRIARRMRLHGSDNLPAYLDYLRLHADEAVGLMQDLLISVTNFFRDPEAFAALEQHVPRLFEGKGPNDAVRVWVPACATGEEAYSIAILLHEHARTLDAAPAIQVFATDLDEHAIHVARHGLYPVTIASDVSEDRLHRFFTRETRGYCIRREVRDSVLFALHDLLGDSPFSRIDLMSCRNLLIYLGREAQVRALDVAHFAMRSSAVLFLGTSESIDEDSVQFAILDKKNHLYTRRHTPRRVAVVPIAGRFLGTTARSRGRTASQGIDVLGRHVAADREKPAPDSSEGGHAHHGISWAQLHYNLLERIGPPSILISQQYEIVHVSAHATRFLQFSSGEPSRDVFQSVHPSLRLELRAAVYRALHAGIGTRMPPVALTVDGQPLHVALRVEPSAPGSPDFVLVLFEAQPADAQVAATAAVADAAVEPAALRLEAELDLTKSQLRDVMERAESSTEELRASNEELQAMNEELRSATEELETGREELLSVNEELTLVNAELKSSVDQLAQSNSDLHNLMASTSIATVFLDRELQVKRYTPSAVELFSLIPSDIGRPLADLRSRIDFGPIRDDAARALQLLTPCEREVESAGEWYIARTLPYRTLDDHIAGVVLTFINITERKRTENALRSSSEQLRLIIENARDYAIFSMNLERHVTTWNSGAERLLGYRSDEIIGKTGDVIFTDEDRAAGAPQDEATQALRDGRAADERWHVRRDGTRFWGSGVMTALHNAAGAVVGLVKIFRDQTEMRLAHEALEQSRQQAEAAGQAKDQFLAVLSHELRTPLSPVSLAIDALSMRNDLPADVRSMLALMRRNLDAQVRMIDELLDITRIARGKMEIERRDVDLHEVANAAVEVCQTPLRNKEQQLELQPMATRSLVVGDFDRLRQAVWNLLQNASKFSPRGGRVRLTTRNDDLRTITLTVSDSGIGIDAAARERIFDAFAQANERITREYGGLGLGLAIVKATVRAHGGEIEAHSDGPGTGATFQIVLPLKSVEEEHRS
jgi:two-component system CheB/CheR fusion protein